jgi:hypothetical protein
LSPDGSGSELSHVDVPSLIGGLLASRGERMKIKLQERYLYGRLVYYPNDEWSRRLLEELNEILKMCKTPVKKCFSVSYIGELKTQGYEIEIQPFDYTKEIAKKKIDAV